MINKLKICMHFDTFMIHEHLDLPLSLDTIAFSLYWPIDLNKYFNVDQNLAHACERIIWDGH